MRPREALAPLLLLALPLRAAPAAARAMPDELRYYYLDVHEPFFEVDPERPELIRTRRRGAQSFRFPARKPPRSLRVFVIGGSTARGFSGTDTLEDLLPEALPGRDVELINCGMSGYDSDREALVLKEVLEHDPDLLVLMSGHNDFFINRSPPASPWLVRAQFWLDGFAWFRALLQRLHGAEWSQATSSPAERLKRLRANLRRMTGAARAKAVPIVLCAPPLNYAGMPPADRFPWTERRILKGWAALLADRAEQAREILRAPAEDAGLQASARGFAWRLLARAQSRAGDGAAAGRSLARAVELGSPDVCGPSCAADIAALAREQGALWADLDGSFWAATPGLAPGPEMFSDEFHWSRRHHHRVSSALGAALALGLPELGWDRLALRRWARRRSAPRQEPETSILLYYAAEKMKISPFLSWRAASWLADAGRTSPRWLQSPAALARAVEASYALQARRSGAQGFRSHNSGPPPLSRLSAHLALARLEQGRCLEAAGALHEPDGEALLVEAAAQACAERPREAAAALRRARAQGLARESDALAEALGLSPDAAPRTGR